MNKQSNKFNKNLTIQCIFIAYIFAKIVNLRSSIAELFGNAVKKRRLDKGWSQMKLAAEANLHLTALGSIERGRRNPSLLTVFLIANALKVEPKELIEEVSKGGPDLNCSDSYTEQKKLPPGRPKK